MSSPSRILITGVSGFVGTHLAERCVERYPQARLYGTVHTKRQWERSVPGLELLYADVRDGQSVQRVIADTRPDLVFHLAAQSSVADSWTHPIGTLQVNTEGLLHLLEAIHAEHLAPRVLVVGSSEEYGRVEEGPVDEKQALHPLNPYAVSKAAQDFLAQQYAIAYALPIIRMRAFNHFGPGQGPQFVVASIARQIALIEADRAEPVLLVGNTESQRDFLSVSDVVEAYLMLGEYGKAGEAYNVGSGQTHSIAEIVRFLIQQCSVSIEVRVDPAHYRPLDKNVLIADTTKLCEHTGWRPQLHFQQALLQTLDYWREKVQSSDLAIS
jgi:GDP-4-dehydro-6-deoxy-D-mannose reductase